MLQERLELALLRIREIPGEDFQGAELLPWKEYFTTVAKFLLLIEDTRQFLEQGKQATATLEELQQRNRALYEDILPENYENSFANPAYAVKMLGEEFGVLVSFLYTEMRSLIGFTYEGRLDELVIRMELFSEVYAAFVYEQQENHKLPTYAAIREILYWFVSDYADVAAEERVREMVCPENNFAAAILRTADFTDLRYLYAYGEYVGENELKMAEFMNSLPEEIINTMADTYTEGYRIGFEVTGKDLSKKAVVDVRYQLGFERMMRRTLENFEKMGLLPVIYRAATSILYNPSIYKNGFYSVSPNRQYEFDHKDDKALFLDKMYCSRKLEVMHTAFEKYKKEARGYAGPAVVETFGEKEFEPVNKPESLKMTDEQSALLVENRTQMGQLQRQYIIEEERSFTIIAFPIPEVGDCFKELFRETIQINTLDYKKYQRIQQTIIDALDQADHCEIKGCNGNHTDLKVNLWKLKNPAKETIFENCVADVNIPVGEVFTSPVLEGTNGVLHVTRVFLNGLEYKDLEITFENGKIQNYNCANFATEEENKAFIKENILFRHKTLPLGEFAIGTNTTAYVAAKKLGVESKMPILIAEKMGPHFAVGDTCYSHAEEVKVYNPDGKEIVARDNEVAALRSVNPSKAYFNCHTDITIPYDELAELTAVKEDGDRITIIQNGRFVLPGTEELNEPLQELS
ncbi:MAG: leucyl aminopeptidase [Firmicutes bacterium CAG:65_45_313]|nr:MAG: leucyl aminopeptidase [Firmicutes bacterium CAG:65_45_313]